MHIIYTGGYNKIQETGDETTENKKSSKVIKYTPTERETLLTCKYA